MANLLSTNFAGGVFEKAVTTTTTEAVTTTPIIGTPVGSPSSNGQQTHASTYTTSGKYVIAYQDTSDPNSQYGKGKAVVVTGAGTDVTYGTIVTVDSSNDFGSGCGLGYDQTNDKVLIAYGTDNNHGHNMIVATVTGTSLTFGSAVGFDSGSTPEDGAVRPQSIVWDDQNDRLVMAYEDDDRDGAARIVTISGTVPTAHTVAEFTSGRAVDICMTYVGGGQVVVAWVAASGGALYMRPGTITGGGTNTITWGVTSISLGNVAGTPNKITIAYDEQNDKVVLFAVISSANTRGRYIAGTVTGTGASAAITFSGGVEFETDGSCITLSAIYHAAAQKILVTYRTTANSGNLTGILATYQQDIGSQVIYTFGSPFQLYASSTGARAVATSYDSDNKKILIDDESNDQVGIVDLLDSTLTLDLSTGSYFTADLQSGGTSSIRNIVTSNVNAVAPKTLTFNLKIIQGSYPRQFLWSGSALTKFKWQKYWLPGTGWVHRPTTSTANDAVDVYSFTTYDNGTTWYSSIVSQDIK